MPLSVQVKRFITSKTFVRPPVCFLKHGRSDSSGSGKETPYTEPFLLAVQTAMHSKSPLDSTMNLLLHPLFPRAHPEPSHFLPLVVAAGAVMDGDEVEDILVDPEGPLGWGIWRWKTLPGEST